MKIAIIGAGFSGLAAAYQLVKTGHQVEVFESAPYPGGLASGFQETQWQWNLEKHYHHIFASDKDILNFFKELGLADLVFFQETRTANLHDGQIARLDSGLALLNYRQLSFVNRLRTGFGMAVFKLCPFGQVFEKFTAKELLIKLMGKQAWQVVWEPLFVGKFGELAGKINAAWFWARIYTRTKKLGYFKGGFGQAAWQVSHKLEDLGVKFYFSNSIQKIKEKNNQVLLDDGQQTKFYDRILFTQTFPALSKIYPEAKTILTKKHQLDSLATSLAAQTLVLQLDQPFFKDQTYWLSINEKNWPFLAVVEHTNFVAKEHYDQQHLLYVGKYLPVEAPEFQFNKNQLLKLYQPYLAKLNPQFMEHVTKIWLFKENFAQPVVYKNHSRLVPDLKLTEQVYWASMQHVYPFDRGVNFAVKLGVKVAKLINQSQLNV